MKTAGNEVISHQGVVTSNSGKSVSITISSESACSGCHASKACNIAGSEKKIVEVNGAYNVKPGDTVDVLMSRSMGYTALVYGYILPFLVVMIVLITLVSFGIPELTSGLVSLASLFPYYLILYIFRDRLNEKFTFTLKV